MKRLLSQLTGKRQHQGIRGRWFYAALAEAAIRPAYGW